MKLDTLLSVPILAVFIWIGTILLGLSLLVIASPFIVIGLCVYIPYKIILWSVGFWWCKGCKKRLWINDKKQYLEGEMIFDVIGGCSGYKYHPACPKCYEKYYGRWFG
jgi:hypothetical protein